MYFYRSLCDIKKSLNLFSIKNNLNCVLLKRCFCEKTIDANTNVSKDVILFKFKNDRNFKIANIFAICQFGFWTYLSIFAVSTLRDAPIENPDETTVWWQKINLGENKYRNGLTILTFSIGFGILAITWMHTLRSVKYLILRKGGQSVTVVTHTPFGENRLLTLGLENVSCRQMRTEAKSQLPIKIRGHAMHYLLDMRGEFRHPKLFDSTCGLAREWK